MITNETSRVRKYVAISILALTVIISVVGSILLIQHWEYMKLLEGQGLIGLFVIALFAGSPLPIPTPSMILTFTMGSVLNPALVALVSSLGNACGNSLVYLVGRGGLVFFKNLGIVRTSDDLVGNTVASRMQRFIDRFRMSKLREAARKNALLAVFILGMYPNPLLMAVVMGMGAARYSFWKFFLVCWAGKIVESAALAYLGYFGLRSILHVFGITLP